MRAAMVALISVAFVACAIRPSGVLEPSNVSAPGATLVNMLVATTRAPSKSPGVVFSGERGANISLASFTISIPPDQNRQIGQVQWPRQLPADPSRNFATRAVTPIAGLPGARGWLNKNLPGSRRVLVFVHGFNNRFEDAVYRFAQIVHDSRTDAAPVLFTWPSRGSFLSYGFDKESANFSRDAFEATLWEIAQDRSVGDITIVAHSMGAWLAMEGLRQMAIRRGHLPASIHNVILASPDIDVDVFQTQWRALQRPNVRFTIFVSRSDRALGLSRRIAGSVDRLGQIDPSTEAYYSALEKSGIVVIDLSALRGGDAFNHSKFAGSPDVVKLIGSRLVTGQTISDADPLLGPRIGVAAIGVGQVVGGAAGAAIAAPIVVFDPNQARRPVRAGPVGTISQ